jgi:hypothetical protein
MRQPGQVQGGNKMAAVKLCQQKMAAEKASSHRRGFSQKRSDLKIKNSTIIANEKKKTQEKKNRLLKQSNQNSLIPSESRNNETKGLQKNRIPRMKSKLIRLHENRIHKKNFPLQCNIPKIKILSITVQ